ncbi:hypothetical protein LCGC14_1230600, partial [marine sediment metagenome]
MPYDFNWLYNAISGSSSAESSTPSSRVPTPSASDLATAGSIGATALYGVS